MIYDKLYKYQRNIVDKFSHRPAFGLFLDMGLGKTPTGLAMAEKNHCTKCIIITIDAKALESEQIDGSWLNWASKSDCKYVLHDKYNDTFDANVNDVMIVNYESLFKRRVKNAQQSVESKRCNKQKRIELHDKLTNFINSCKGHNVAILVDESHKIKNLQSKQTLAITALKKELSKHSKVFIYLLTGTPFTKGYEDLYSQLKMLGCPMTKTEFVDRFCVRGNIPGLLGWQQPIVGYKNVDELFNLLHQYAITIKSEDVIELPDKIFTKHITPVSNDFKAFTSEKLKSSDIIKIYKAHKLDTDVQLINKKDILMNNPFFRNIAYPSEKWLAETAGTNWLRARQLSIGFQGNAEEYKWFDRSRLDMLKAFLEQHEDNYLLFYNFTPELLEIYDICDELGYNIDIYSGEIKSMMYYEKYASQSEAEQLTNKKNIILANFASGSTGMNWQKYNHCIIFSCPIYKDYEQGIKRIHRLGQKQTTFYHIFYQNNWLDKGMNEALEQCIDYSSDMFKSDLNRVNTLMTEEDN